MVDKFVFWGRPAQGQGHCLRRPNVETTQQRRMMRMGEVPSEEKRRSGEAFTLLCPVFAGALEQALNFHYSVFWAFNGKSFNSLYF
jgi:hypothetical protein